MISIVCYKNSFGVHTQIDRKEKRVLNVKRRRKVRKRGKRERGKKRIRPNEEEEATEKNTIITIINVQTLT